MLLNDVLIIDATDRLGWLAGRLLADLGADVIKIERKGSERSASQWRAVNVNKRVVEHDGAQAADRENLAGLLACADICLLTPGSSQAPAELDPHALRASECTQPAMRDLAFSMSLRLKKSSGLTLSTG